MQLSSAAGVAARLRRLVFQTQQPIQFLDITNEVAELVRVAGLRDGVATVFSRHTTAAVCIQEAEPLLLEDLRAKLAVQGIELFGGTPESLAAELADEFVRWGRVIKQANITPE